jgi:hypothetical protein
MKIVSRILAVADWVLTSLVVYVLMEFGLDGISRFLAIEYVHGNASGADVWVTSLGIAAIGSTYFLIHSRTRFYAAAALAIVLCGESLNSLVQGYAQTMQVPLLSLGAASLVLLTRRPKNAVHHQAAASESVTSLPVPLHIG